MPTITVQKADLYQLAGLDPALGLAQLEERLWLVKGELGSRTVAGRSLRNADGGWGALEAHDQLRIELKDTNRPDLWCVEGIARQLRDHAQGHGQAYPFFTRETADLTIQVDPALASLRPFIGGFLATGNPLDETGLLALIEAQETLTYNFGHKRKTVSIGVYDGAQMTFPVQYKAVEREAITFVPLPPAAEQTQWPTGIAMTPQEILERHPTGREYAALLARMTAVPLLTTAQGEVLSLIPIINSAGLGRVTPGMDNLFVEASGTEQDHVLLALNILATNLADRGWQITPATTHYPYATPRGRTVSAPHAMPITLCTPVGEFARWLGEPVDTADVLKQLTAYGIDTHAEGDQISATAPSYRQDYLHPVDVIEDYAISRGYMSFAPSMAQSFTVGKLTPLTQYEDLVRDLMIGFGFEEAICNILTSSENVRQQMNVNETDGEQGQPFHGGRIVRIENVMNLNYSVLRDWITPSLLEIEAHSAGALYPHQVFEVGEVAVYDPTQNLGSRTEARLAAIIAAEDASFDAMQSVLYALLTALKLPFKVEHWTHPSFIPGRVALVTSQTTQPVKLGFLGELSPQVLTNWGARVPVVALELALQLPMINGQ
ncbi:MAG: phenylalanine--tRNA ligase subunit beta [Caldilineaceae bacterium]